MLFTNKRRKLVYSFIKLLKKIVWMKEVLEPKHETRDVLETIKDKERFDKKHNPYFQKGVKERGLKTK